MEQRKETGERGGGTQGEKRGKREIAPWLLVDYVSRRCRAAPRVLPFDSAFARASVKKKFARPAYNRDG